MRRILAATLSCLLLGIGILPATAQSPSVQELIQRVNDYRAANGMPALEVHPALMTAAQRQATWLAANYLHSHEGEGGTMPQDRAAAAGYPYLANENVASGTIGYATPAWAVQGWASSYGHRLTMLAQRQHIGVGIAENDEETYFILLVGGTSSIEFQPLPGAVDETEAQPAVVAPIVVATPREDGAIVHVVQEGQTAWAIAARYGISLADLLAINALSEEAVLYPGEELVVQLGEGQQPSRAPAQPEMIIVQSGDSLWSIAAAHGLTLDEVLTLNGLAENAIISPGDEVRIRAPLPTSTPTPAPTTPPRTAQPPTPSRTPSPTATATSSPVPTATLTLPPPVTLEASPSTRTVSPVGIMFAMLGLIAVIVAGGLLALLLRIRRQS